MQENVQEECSSMKWETMGGKFSFVVIGSVKEETNPILRKTKKGSEYGSGEKMVRIIISICQNEGGSKKEG